MFFRDLLKSERDRQGYDRVCGEFSDFFQECSRLLVMAWEIVHEAAGKDRREYHSNVLALVRHVIESLDGISILVSKGGSHSCQPLLRGALEAALGVLYILEKDTEPRALAYAVAHAHKEIKKYTRLDPTTPAGREFRRLLEGDLFEVVFNRLPVINYPQRIANLEAMLGREEYRPVETEWRRMKAEHPRREDPAWYSLFGGPRNVRALAIHVKSAGMYEFLYRVWSDEVHAGNALATFGRADGEPVWRPVRHPEQLQPAVQHGSGLALMLAKRLVEVYAPEKWPELQGYYMEKISARANELGTKQVIRAPWKDTEL